MVLNVSWNLSLWDFPKLLFINCVLLSTYNVGSKLVGLTTSHNRGIATQWGHCIWWKETYLAWKGGLRVPNYGFETSPTRQCGPSWKFQPLNIQQYSASSLENKKSNNTCVYYTSDNFYSQIFWTKMSLYRIKSRVKLSIVQ